MFFKGEGVKLKHLVFNINGKLVLGCIYIVYNKLWLIRGILTGCRLPYLKGLRPDLTSESHNYNNVPSFFTTPDSYISGDVTISPKWLRWSTGESQVASRPIRQQQ